MSSKINKPSEPPKGLQTRGQALWRSTFGEFELAEHEQTLLLEACRTVDLLDLLQAQIDEDGVVLAWCDGWRNHPALAEARQQRLVLARLLAALRVPADESQDQQQQQSRDRFHLVVGLVASMALGGSMRRRRVFPDLPPQHLLEFNAADWPQGMSGHRLSFGAMPSRAFLSCMVGPAALRRCFG